MQLVMEDKSWNRCSRQMRRNKHITKTAENLHMTLLDRVTNETNIVKMSARELARELNCCLKSVFNAIQRLIGLGFIEKLDKDYPTEVNCFIVKEILPPKKRNKSVERAQFETFQPERKTVKQVNKPSEPAKKKYGENGRVRLTDEEYSNLVSDFGQEIVEDYIKRVDNYSVKHNRWYKNNAETIRNWIEKDRETPRFKNKQKKKAKKNKFTEEELQGYLALVERLEENLDEDESVKDLEQSDTNKNQCEEVEPPVHPTGYELTDEEIKAIENSHFEMILNNSLHPLYYCTPGELMVLAEKWKKYKKMLL